MYLTEMKIKKAKPKDKAYKISDGDGMHVLVSPNGSKYWRLKYRFDGKEKLLALGIYPEVTLTEAREKRLAARKLISQKIDPGAKKRQDKIESKLSSQSTFEVIARKWHEKKQSELSERYATTIMTRLEADVFPRIGHYPIKDITPRILLNALQEIEKRGVYEITRRAKQYCGQILRFAIPYGLVDRDITVDLKDALETRKTQHYASIEPNELPKFLKDLNSNNARMYPTTKLAVELMLLTFVRTGEMIKAKWDEIDFKEAMWTIPPERMKMGKAHLVPLSTQAMEVLKQIRRHNGNYEWIFASHTRPRNHMSNNAILKALERMGYKGRMTGHGFRSLGMTTILEKLSYPFDVADAQLAHAKKGSLGAAYDRAKYLDQRKVMMQDWADYLDKVAQDGNKVILGKFGTAS